LECAVRRSALPSLASTATPQTISHHLGLLTKAFGRLQMNILATAKGQAKNRIQAISYAALSCVFAPRVGSI
jgi:hypothetical protein